MPDIRFNCAQCNQSIEVDESAAGVAIQCPHCRASLTVPMPEAPARPALKLKKTAPPEQAPQPPIVERTLHKTQSKPEKRGIPTSLIVKVLAVVVVIAAGFFVYRHFAPRPQLVTLSNYAKLRNGMTEDEVTRLFGRPSEKSYRGDEAGIWENLSVTVLGGPGKDAFRPILDEISTATELVRLPSGVAQAKGTDTILSGRDVRSARNPFGRSKAGVIGYEFGNQPLEYNGTLHFDGHEGVLAGTTNQLKLLSNGAIQFTRVRDRDAKMAGRMMSWKGHEGRAIYVNFVTNLTFWAYQGPAAEISSVPGGDGP